MASQCSVQGSVNDFQMVIMSLSLAACFLEMFFFLCLPKICLQHPLTCEIVLVKHSTYLKKIPSSGVATTSCGDASI